MNRARSVLLSLAVLALAPLPLLAQGGPGPMGPLVQARLLLEQGSVEFLAGKAAELTLDEPQTTRLREIGAAWAAATKESREKIRGELPQPGQAWSGDRETMRARFEALQPQLTKLVEEDEKSLGEALQLLTETQQARARQLLEERRQNARPRRSGGG